LITGNTEEKAMTITRVPFAVLGFQYRIARFPLQLIEDRMAARMGAEAPARLLYERSLGKLDATIGTLLGDSKLKMRGSALAERSDALSRAARLDAAATQKLEHAEAELKATREKAIDDQKRAEDVKEREFKDARTEAEERKNAAAEAAEKRIAAATQHADEVAAQRTSSVNEAKRGAQARIRVEEDKATAAARSKLENAQAKRNDAESKRAQADRVEQLADVEKQKRQASRASKSRQ
jgi:hypothetical protein